MALGFGRDRRLRKHAEFVRAQSSGRRVATAHFTLLVAAQAAQGVAGGPGPSRLGVVVARRIGSAIRRNRVKRVCRECFRLWPGLVPSGVDLVVIARDGADGLGLAEVRSEWAAVEVRLRQRAAEALALARSRESNHPAGDGSRPRAQARQRTPHPNGS